MAMANGHVCFVSPHFPWAACVSASVCKAGYLVALLYCSDMDVTSSPWAVNGKAFCEALCELIIPLDISTAEKNRVNLHVHPIFDFTISMR